MPAAAHLANCSSRRSSCSSGGADRGLAPDLPDVGHYRLLSRTRFAFYESSTIQPEGARELLETPYVCYFARLNAMTAQLEPAAEIHWS
jgi:hypothetical protein